MIYRHKFLRRTKNRRSDPLEIAQLISKEDFSIPENLAAFSVYQH
jgi:hypothetical protein